MPEAHQALLVFVNMPDKDSAVHLAEMLVENRLAACVNLLSPCRSIYRWQGKVEQAEEIPMLIKTGKARYPELEAFIHANHPYEVPEIIAVSLTYGLPSYLDWVEAMTVKEEEVDTENRKVMTCV